jgi:hypothetical protein
MAGMIGLDETPTVTPSPVNMFPLAECLFLPQTMNPPVSTSNASDSTDAATINGQINSNGVLHQIVPDPLGEPLSAYSVRNFPCQTLKISKVSLVVMGS